MKKVLVILTVLIAAAAIVLVTTSASPKSGAQYHRKVDRFFSMVEAGEIQKAVDFIYSDNPWMQKSSDSIQNVKAQLIGLKELVGDYQGHELILEKQVADRFAFLYYFVAYDRQPLQFVFEYYKPEDKWMIFSFSFDANIDDIIEARAAQDLFKD